MSRERFAEEEHERRTCVEANRDPKVLVLDVPPYYDAERVLLVLLEMLSRRRAVPSLEERRGMRR